MEQYPSKRRKVEDAEDQATEVNCELKVRKRAGSLRDRRDKQPIPKLVLPAHHAFGVHGVARREVQHLHGSRESGQAEPTKVQARQLTDTITQSADAASTVLAIAIDDGQGVVSEIDVPMASKSVYISGYGELTIANGATVPTVTAPAVNHPGSVQFNPAAVTPPPAVAASQARNQALQTQEAIAKQLNVVPQAPSSAASAPSSAAEAQHTAASQSPMAVNTPGSRSQQILSSPPTPNPTTPQPSGSSLASYFSSSPASLPASSLAPTSSPSPSVPPNTINSQPPASHNSTISSNTLSSSSITVSSSSRSVSSHSSDSISSFSAQSTASRASLSSSESVIGLTSATSSPSGFATSTRTSQSLSSGSSSTQTTPTITSLLPSTSASTSLSASASASTPVSSQSAPQSSSFGSASTSGLGAGSVGSPSNTAAAASPTSSSGSGSGGSNTPPASVLAGGIVGGVAGAALLLLLLLLFFRWRRGKTAQRQTISPPVPQPIGPGGLPQAGDMTQRSSTTPIAGAGFFSRLRPASSQTVTTADTAPSERGFQKISGRKLTSVLTSGGDGYGDASMAGPSMAASRAAAGPHSAVIGGPQSRNILPDQGPFAGLAPPLRPPSPSRSLSGSSFYRDSHGFYGGVVPENAHAETETSSSPSTSPSYPAPLNFSGQSAQGPGSSSSRQPEVAITRPGPARTPVINQPGVVPMRTPSRVNHPQRPARATPPPQNPFLDGLGRSHPSQDGSRGSRFREDTTPP